MLAPTIGAVTPGLASSQASATCGVRHAALARDLGDAVDDPEIVLLVVHLVGEVVVCAPGSSRRFFSRRLRLPVRKPRASGLQGIRPMPSLAAERDHLALLLAIDQVVVVLHGDEARQPAPVGACRASWRTARRYMDEAPI